MFNVTGITVTINGDNLESVKYLGLYIDDTLNWQTHVAYITKLCSQRIGLFKKVLPYFSNDVALLYYNAFIKSRFSYCLMFWINNERSGRFRLFDKVNRVISLLAKHSGTNIDKYVATTNICDVMKTSKLQCLSFMYNIMYNLINLPYVNVNYNNMVHQHNTRQSKDIHVDAIFFIDKRNSLYQFYYAGINVLCHID